MKQQTSRRYAARRATMSLRTTRNSDAIPDDIGARLFRNNMRDDVLEVKRSKQRQGPSNEMYALNYRSVMLQQIDRRRR